MTISPAAAASGASSARQPQQPPSRAPQGRPMSSVWGPGYQSVICHGTPPGERGSRNSAALSAAATAMRQSCAAEGRGWGNGTIPGLAPDAKRPPQARQSPQALQAAALAQAAQPAQPDSARQRRRVPADSRLRPFNFKRVGGRPGAPERVYQLLRDMPADASMTDEALGELLRRPASQMRVMLRDATHAGVFVAKRRGNVTHYRLGPTTPSNAARPG